MQPVLSVLMITYNHEKYIEEAIRGVLMQKTSFAIELVIADDCSTDNTSDIIQNIICTQKKGVVFNYIRQIKNVGAQKNWFYAHSKCKGKYIAICEGDDYWTDPLKLQKQVDFLEKNEDYILSCHNANILSVDNRISAEVKVPVEFQKDFRSIELMKISLISTLTVVFRNQLKHFPEILKRSPNGDVSIFSYLGQFGKSKFHFDIENGVYRVHNGGIWSQKSVLHKNQMQLKTYKNLYQYYNSVNNSVVSEHFKGLTLHFTFTILNQLQPIAKLKFVVSSILFFYKIKESKMVYSIIKRIFSFET